MKTLASKLKSLKEATDFLKQCQSDPTSGPTGALRDAHAWVDVAAAEVAEAFSAVDVGALAVADELLATVRAIRSVKPVVGMNPNARVGDANGVTWNVHMMADEAIEKVEEARREH